MPIVNGKHYPYNAQGMAAAKKAMMPKVKMNRGEVAHIKEMEEMMKSKKR